MSVIGRTRPESGGTGHIEPESPAPARTRRGGGRRRVRWTLIPAWFLLVLGAASMVLPVLFILLTSFRTPKDYARDPASVPREWTLDNVRQAWTVGHFNEYAVNSLWVVAVATLLVVVVSALAAFPLVFIPFRGSQAALTAVIALMILPASIMVVPTFKVVLQLQLQSTYTGLILVYVALSCPFGIYILSNSYRAIPLELMDAAYLDGASQFKAFVTIIIPLAAPSLRTLTVLTALSLWNELLFSLVIMQAPEMRTLTAGVALINSNPQLSGVDNTPVLAAALGLTSVLPFVLYLIFNSSISRGMTAGALK